MRRVREAYNKQMSPNHSPVYPKNMRNNLGTRDNAVGSDLVLAVLAMPKHL